MIGCAPRACEERLKKLRRLAKGWALGDSGETDGEWGGGGKDVNGKKRRRRTEEERNVEGDGNGGHEPPEDIPAPMQEKRKAPLLLLPISPFKGKCSIRSRSTKSEST